jgi:hypothetical protein
MLQGPIRVAKRYAGPDLGNLCEACLPVMAVQEQLEADLDARFEALDAIPHRFQQFKLNFQAKASSVCSCSVERSNRYLHRS